MRMKLASFVPFLRSQSLYLTLSAVVIAVLWANGQQVNPLTVLLYTLSIGNLTVLTLAMMNPWYSQRRFPYNWLFFLVAFLAIIPLVYAVSTTLVWLLARTPGQTLIYTLQTEWKLAILFTFLFGVFIFLFQNTRQRLERRNLELQQSVERGSAQLEMQEQELQRAHEIQQALLPKTIPQLRGFEISGAWRPARTVSGDYFDVFRLGENRLAICIADVSGKGVSAALLMANVQAAVRAFASEAQMPAGLCGKVNRLLCENVAVGKFVTFFFCILDGESHKLDYCNAGHLAPILVTGGVAQSIDGGGAVLGVFPEWKYETAMIELRPGDRLLLFTDGITEAEDEQAAEFGAAQVVACAQKHCAETAAELNRLLLEQVAAFCGSRFQDDATLLVIAAN